jgi:hypothetical protein
VVVATAPGAPAPLVSSTYGEPLGCRVVRNRPKRTIEPPSRRADICRSRTVPGAHRVHRGANLPGIARAARSRGDSTSFSRDYCRRAAGISASFP